MRKGKLSERQIAGLRKRRVTERVRRRVDRVVGSPHTWEQAALAAVLSIGDDAAASHSSGARLWDYRYLSDEECLEVVVPRRSLVIADGVRVHRTVLLDAADVTTRNGVRVTTYERTLCDLTTQLSWLQAGKVLDDGLRRKVATLDRLRDCLERLDSGPRRRLTVIHSLLSQRQSDFNPGGSGSELRLLELVREAGLPEPVQQYRMRVNGATYYLDYAWPSHQVFAEWYGLPWHIGASAVAYDSARTTAMSTVRWRPLIFTDASSDEEIVRDLRSALS
jgi:hypothetical protein